MRLVQRFQDGYTRFVEKQSFPIIVTLCVAVITATALWTKQTEDVEVSPPPSNAQNVSAAQLLQQSIKDALTPTPAPTEMPRQWMSPLEDAIILRAFASDFMVQSGVTGIWSIHDAIDLTSEHTNTVRAISDGVVIASGEDRLLGAWLQIDHGEGIIALYAGLADIESACTGDPVRAGDVIASMGSGPLDETDLGAHLHLRVAENGRALNPVQLWQSTD